MTLHAFIEYLKYSWKGKGRHGTHSPFVYDLVERVVQSRLGIDKTYLVRVPGVALRYENLVSRIAAYYKYADVLRLPEQSGATVPDKIDLLLLHSSKPMQWKDELDEYFHLLKNSSAVIVTDIHKTALHTTRWLALCADTRVRMSIDMYGVGMLLFREEFKVKQHFVVKY